MLHGQRLISMHQQLAECVDTQDFVCQLLNVRTSHGEHLVDSVMDGFQVLIHIVDRFGRGVCL